MKEGMINSQIFQDQDGDPDNLYLNIRINHNAKNGPYNTIAEYDVTKTTPYINNPSKFYCSVISAAIPLNIVPLGIAKTTINPLNHADPNYMTASITIVNPGGEYPTPLNSTTVNLTFIPTTERPPPIPHVTQQNPTGQIISPYYYFYTYSNIIQSFNNAILSAFNIAFSPGPIKSAGAPYFFMDYSTELIKLVVSDEFVNGADLYINYESVYYLQAFNYFAQGVPPQVPGAIFKFVFYEFNNVCNYYGQNFGVAGGGYWLYSQEYFNLQDFTSTRKILLTTDFIPIRPEFVSINTPSGTQTGLSPTANVIFDYTPNIKTATDAKTINFYESGYPRLCDLSGNIGPLSRIDIKVYWQDVDGYAYPLYISVYQAINIKLAFYRKSLFKNNWTQNKMIKKIEEYIEENKKKNNR